MEVRWGGQNESTNLREEGVGPVQPFLLSSVEKEDDRVPKRMGMVGQGSHKLQHGGHTGTAVPGS